MYSAYCYRLGMLTLAKKWSSQTSQNDPQPKSKSNITAKHGTYIVILSANISVLANTILRAISTRHLWLI